ncbi:hypothetical protein Chor_010562, partial [Crotalus horridus]
MVPLPVPQGLLLLLLLRPQDTTLKLCLIRSVCLISQAVCHSAQSGDFSFSRKAEVVAQMLDFIKAETPDALRTPIRQKAMTACMYLVLSRASSDALGELGLPHCQRALQPRGLPLQ